MELGKQIHDIFPKEHSTNFYSPRTVDSNGAVRNVQGILYDKYIEIRQQLNKFGAIAKAKRKHGEPKEINIQDCKSWFH